MHAVTMAADRSSPYRYSLAALGPGEIDIAITHAALVMQICT
jgi:hypothetical protein